MFHKFSYSNIPYWSTMTASSYSMQNLASFGHTKSPKRPKMRFEISNLTFFGGHFSPQSVRVQSPPIPMIVIKRRVVISYRQWHRGGRWPDVAIFGASENWNVRIWKFTCPLAPSSCLLVVLNRVAPMLIFSVNIGDPYFPGFEHR